MGEHVSTFRRYVLAQPDHARLLQQRRQRCLAGFERLRKGCPRMACSRRPLTEVQRPRATHADK
jgi:hypothetical protein